MIKPAIEDHRAHDAGVVAGHGAFDEGGADAGQGEHGLDDDGAGDDADDGRAEIADHRQDGSGGGVAEEDAAFADALGASGADEVGAHHLDHRGAHQARDDGDLRQGQRDDRQEQVVEVHPSEIEAAGGEPFQVDAEQHGEQRTGHERGDGDADHGDAHHRVVGKRVLPDGGEHAEQDAEEHGDGDREQTDGQRDGQALAQQLADVLVVENHGGAEVALHHFAQIVEILFLDRLVEAEAGLEVGFDRRGQHAFGRVRVAGRRAHHEEHDGDDHQHGRDRRKHAAADIGPGDAGGQTGERVGGRGTRLVGRQGLRPLHERGYKDEARAFAQAGKIVAV